MSLSILSIGTAVPATVMNQAEALQLARVLCARTTEQASWLPGVYGQTGIDARHLVIGRHVVDDILNGSRTSGSVFLPSPRDDDRGPTTGQRMDIYAAEASPLALRAARQAMSRSGVRSEEITHLVTVSCTGFHAPGIDLRLVRDLHLKPTIQRTHVGFMGCHGALNGLQVAAAFMGSKPAARVLLGAVELCSLHYHYGWDPQKMVANALFADGAAAMVAAASEVAPKNAWRVAAFASCLFPESEDAMTWTMGDHGFVMTLSKRVPGLIAANLRPWLRGWLEENGLGIGDVASWAIHPGGPRILGAVEESLGLPHEATAASREILAEVGNVSSATLLFILKRLHDCKAPLPCVAIGFGPGLVAEAVLFH